LPIRSADFGPWRSLVKKIKKPKKKLSIGIVGKYLKMEDTYMSVTEALKHACWQHNLDLDLVWIDAQKLSWKKNKEERDKLRTVNGVVVPGGFGKRGFEGKIFAANYCRTKNKPYLGLCLGLQMAVVEFARNVLKLEKANTEEATCRTPDPVIHFLKGQKNIAKKGGTMRLGAYPCVLDKNSKAYAAYREKRVSERHRHRLEVNNRYRDRLAKNGMRIAGTLPDKSLVEIVEVVDHPWFVAVQFHPEFKSRPLKAHPLFRDFIGAALRTKNS
jgi:CTP synthase